MIHFQSALFKTNSALLFNDDHLLLVDPNWLPAELDRIAEEVARVGEGREKFLLFTHSDYDHIIGFGKFAHFTTIASRRLVDNPEAAGQLAQTLAWDDEYYIDRTYELVYPRIDRPVAGDDTTLLLGGDTYEFFQAPGHNYDGLLTFNRDQGILIVGDYLSDVEFPYVYHSVADYRATLDKLERLIRTGGVRRLVPGHGAVTDDRKEMQRRLGEAFRYLDRLEAAAKNGTDFDPVSLSDRYRYPGIMQRFHTANLDLMRRELGLATG